MLEFRECPRQRPLAGTADMIDFCRGCGSGDGSPFQGSVFSGPDLLDPANRVRRSHCSPPPNVSCRALDLLSPKHSFVMIGALGFDHGCDEGRSPTPALR